MNLQPTYKVLPSYDHLIEKGNNRTLVIARNGGLHETIALVKKTIRDYSFQVRKLAQHLKGDTHLQSDYNIWHWIKHEIKYAFDTPNTEEVRSPYASYRDGSIKPTIYRAANIAPHGVDCEDYTTLVCCLLHEMGYNGTPYIVAFNHRVKFQHIFPQDGETVLDDVMPAFNALPNNITKSMKIELLNGIPEETPIQGIGAIEPPDTVTKKLMNLQSALLQRIENGGYNEQVVKELRKLRYAILLNGSEERNQILQLLPKIDDITPEGEYIFKEGEELEGLGKIRFGKLIKSVGKVIKKGFNDQVKLFKLATFALPRSGILLAFRLNIGRIASRMKFGYLTREQAIKKKLDLKEWETLVARTHSNENLFESIGGKKSNFRKAVIKGGHGLSGLVQPKDLEPIDLKGIESEMQGTPGLGFAPLAAVAAAVPFVTKIAGALKDVNFKSMFSKSTVNKEDKTAAEQVVDTGADAIKNALTEGFKSPEEQAIARKAEQDDYVNKKVKTSPLVVGGIVLGVAAVGALALSKK